MATKIDIHAVLKQAIKDLPADANPADVAAYIDAECAKQAAIEGAAAAEEKKAEKEVAASLEDAPKDMPPGAKPEDVPPGEKVDEPPPAMAALSSQLPGQPTQVDPPAGGSGVDAKLADAPPAASDAGMAQLEALLSEKGSNIAALIDVLKAGALDAILAGSTGADTPGTLVSEGQMEGLRSDFAAKTAEVKKLTAELAAAHDQIATFKQAAATSAAKVEKTEAEKKAEAEAAAEKAKTERRAAFGARIGELIKTARLIPARGRTTDQTIELWSDIGMTQPERFEEMVADLPPGVPTDVISARSTGPTMRLSAPGGDGDRAHGEVYELSLLQYRKAGFSEKDAQAAAKATADRLESGAAPTTKLTGAA